MFTTAQATLYMLESKEWYVTDLTFLGGDQMFDQWVGQTTGRKTYLHPNTLETAKANLWVAYVPENASRPTMYSFQIESDAEALGFLQSVNTILQMNGMGGGRGRRANYEMQRKTWKEHQGKVDSRRLTARAMELNTTGPTPLTPSSSFVPPGVEGMLRPSEEAPRKPHLPLSEQIGKPEIEHDLTTPEGREAFRRERLGLSADE